MSIGMHALSKLVVQSMYHILLDFSKCIMGQQMVFNFRKVNIYILGKEKFNYSGKSLNCIQFNYCYLFESAIQQLETYSRSLFAQQLRQWLQVYEQQTPIISGRWGVFLIGV